MNLFAGLIQDERITLDQWWCFGLTEGEVNEKIYVEIQRRGLDKGKSYLEFLTEVYPDMASWYIWISPPLAVDTPQLFKGIVKLYQDMRDALSLIATYEPTTFEGDTGEYKILTKAATYESFKKLATKSLERVDSQAASLVPVRLLFPDHHSAETFIASMETGDWHGLVDEDFYFGYEPVIDYEAKLITFAEKEDA